MSKVIQYFAFLLHDYATFFFVTSYCIVDMERKEDLIKVNISVILFKEEDSWIAYSPELELSSYGDTEYEAKEAFGSVLKIFISETTKKGTLEKCLLDMGWQLRKKPVAEYIPGTETSNRIKRTGRKHVYDENIMIPV